MGIDRIFVRFWVLCQLKAEDEIGALCVWFSSTRFVTCAGFLIKSTRMAVRFALLGCPIELFGLWTLVVRGPCLDAGLTEWPRKFGLSGLIRSMFPVE